MNRTFFSGITATLLVSTLVPAPAHADALASTDSPIDQGTQSAAEARSRLVNSAPSDPEEPVKLGSQRSETKPPSPARPEQFSTPTPKPTTATTPVVQPPEAKAPEVVKVGERQSPATEATVDRPIAKVHPHTQGGRDAATLYVHNIPVLTFVGSPQTSEARVKVGTQASQTSPSAAPTAFTKSLSDSASPDALPPAQNSSDDPVWRASELAAKLNQLNRDGIDPAQIRVSQIPKPEQEQYSIKLADKVLAVVSATTILPDTTKDLEHDALQATNRLRRLLGNAPPLTAVANRIPRPRQIAIGSIRLQISGLASWYGPGFHGNQSASGEIFNENALTAAHPTLPFGTRVRVTNLHNGATVLVRINDRGPFVGNRVIDLSAGAARVLGLIQAGVAPVRLDILDSSSVVADTGRP
jgi:rare lipoprotein A